MKAKNLIYDALEEEELRPSIFLADLSHGICLSMH